MDVANRVVKERNNYMAIYLNDFIFRSSDEESELLSLARRTCFESYYPMNIFPSKGLGRVIFDPVTIFYGGNGSGKSTILNIIAARLKELRKIPFKPSQFFDWYVDGLMRLVHSFVEDYEGYVDPLSFNSDLSEEWKGLPAESRILTSEDVFDKTLTVRGGNRAPDTRCNMNYRKPVACPKGNCRGYVRWGELG